MHENDIPQMIEQLLQAEKERNYEKIKHAMIAQLEQEKNERKEYEDRLYSRWKNALDLFETILLLGLNAGSEYNQQIRPYAAKQNDFVFEVLTRIHGRSCMTASAILTLLKSGHASDALARARTLHELRVIATFIKEGGDDLAEMYLGYEVVESLKIMRQYEQYQTRLGLEPLELGAVKKLEHAVERYYTKFMPNLHKHVLKGDYGWAAIYLNNTRPTFKDIEEKVGLAHWRPYFKFASHPTHAGVKGIKFDIGFNLGDQNVLFAGPSNAGLVDPASISLIAFSATTALLLTHMRYLNEKGLLEIHLKSLTASQVLQELLKEAEQAFLKVHQRLIFEVEELEKRAKGIV